MILPFSGSKMRLNVNILIFEVKFGQVYFFTNFAEIFTRVVFEVEKFVDQVRFA